MKPHQDATTLPKITFLAQDEVHRLFAVIRDKRDYTTVTRDTQT
ncbi:MAG TPA: hypothetical protein VIH59_17735 [Candidatus Tectomicrobia bacterium]|jgi:hypothetical protein